MTSQINCSGLSQVTPTCNKTLKQKFGSWLIPRLPINRHTFNHFRLELNSWYIRNLHQLHPGYKAKINHLKQQQNLLVNVGCGPFGKADWINLDLYSHPNVTLRTDARKNLPLADNSCSGIHVEHFLEHLEPTDERPDFLRNCYRSLQSGGVLRIIVPDAELYIKAYLEPGWENFNYMGCGGDVPEKTFKTKMQALNHVFVQGWEHYGGYDAETLELELSNAGFTNIKHQEWRKGDFPKECIDREQHRLYSLYFEAIK